MKRIILLALCLIIMTVSAFAQDKAIGGGVMYNNTSTKMEYSGSGFNEEYTLKRNGFGAFAFFGLGRFLELNLGFMYKNPYELNYSISSDDYGSESGTITDLGTYIEGTSALQLGAYFKYPIPINDTLVFFPTGGADFELSLNSNETDFGKWWHDLWLRAGVGLDIFLNEKTFLRAHALYGAAIPVGGDVDMGLKFGHGLLIKFGIGFML